MRRATSGASIGPLSKQLTPILSVAAHEGPYAFKFKGLTLWLVKTPRLKLLGAFRGTAPLRSDCAAVVLPNLYCPIRFGVLRSSIPIFYSRVFKGVV